MKKCKVVIGKNAWEMTRTQVMSLLKIASEQIPFGIYAVQKGDYYEMRREHAESITQLKESRRNYKAQGWKVWCNGV